MKIGPLRRPVGRAFMLGCFAGCTKNIQRSARLPVLLQQHTVLTANPTAWSQGQCSGRFGIDRDGWNLVGFAASVRSSITMAVARISGRRNEAMAGHLVQRNNCITGISNAIADQGNGRGTRRWHPSITTGICAT